ncbi:hypothetical protein D9Q98_003153 [Chlorella vulgaris]|uniref:Fe2OG dioxygenase domain-containing protein n=1 Tax=Chlorella vulgaris TaxID=3077 RepID=A0A9D4TSG6_CHLVU|nr:hypothetical protein D9Q98_003153 [Chlorella vulgaris]
MAVIDGVLSQDQCRRLVWVARCLSVVGYRACVCSATIFDVVAACPELLLDVVAARQAVREAVEKALDRPLLVEFTGLVSWRPGSEIKWHHDANRPYLQQRAFSAVSYLNSSGHDFQGGTFRFQTGQPNQVHAVPGRVVAYSAQAVHCVEPITAGERFTLTLWFTEAPAHCEDAKVLARLTGSPQSQPGLPVSMWRLPDGTDLRLCRLAMAGFALVWQGRVLHGTEDCVEQGYSGLVPKLKLAVQPAVFRLWLCWQRATAGSSYCGPGGDPDTAAAPLTATAGAHEPLEPDGSLAAEIVKGAHFDGIQQAVLALQQLMQDRCWPCCSTRERVCEAHLFEGPTPQFPAPTCTWLRSCELRRHNSGAPAQPPITADELRVAVTASQAALAKKCAALQVLKPRWLDAGALFCDESCPSMLPV